MIYDSHNVDHLLFPIGSKEARRTKRLESRLPYLVHEIWCCSEVDKKEFQKLNDKHEDIFKVVPNGAFESENAECYDASPFCLGIIGSWSYKPNIEGLEWFLDHVEKDIPSSISIRICGTGDMPLHRVSNGIFRANRIYGEVSHVSEFYNAISVLAIPCWRKRYRLKPLNRCLWCQFYRHARN